MKSVNKTVTIWYSAQEMFDLVADIEKYPQFLPWCSQSRLIEKTTETMTAELGLSFKGIEQTFITKNHHIPAREIKMNLVKGPFSNLNGTWTFTPILDKNNQEQRACTITLQLTYGFSNIILSKIIGPVFDKIANTMVDAFIERAEQIYE